MAPLDEETAKKVIRQVEFYFSDSNLPRDGFLKKTISESDDGLVSLALICSFSRMRGHLSLGDVKPDDVSEDTVKSVAETLKTSNFLKISEDGTKVGRVTELPKPEEAIKQSDERTIAASPLESEVKLEDVESFFSQHAKVNSVRLPRHVADNKVFCGTALVEFSTEEDAANILKQTLSYSGVELQLKAKKDYDAERAKEEEEVTKNIGSHTLRVFVKGMSSSHEAEKLEEPEFKWGKKRGIGGKKKDVQFYETFTYDGVDYALYDCVFMYKEGEPAPYIGKIVKIWANPDKSNSKRVKVHWFFRPSEIAHHLKEEKVLENELFFASGDGTGLANLNPLEAIAGKCHVVCISTDSRNPQPSAEELKMADYVFYRIFDVKSCTVSHQFNATVGGIEVKFVFNRSEKEVSPLDSNIKNQERNLKTLKIAGESTPRELDNVKVDENDDRVLEREDKNAKQVKVEEQNLLRECSSGGEETMKSARKPGNLDDRPLKKAKLDGAVLSSKTKDTNSVQSSTLTGKDESQLKNSVGSGKDVKLTEMSKEKTRLGLDKKVKSTKDSNAASQGKLSKTNVFPSAENPESAHAKDSVSIEKDKRKGEKSSDFRVKSSTNVVYPDETATPRKTSVSSDETPKKTGPLEGSEQASKLVKSSSASTKRPLKTSANLSKGKSKLGNDAYFGEKDSTLEGGPPKKGKIDDSVNMTKDNKNNVVKKLKEKASVGETQNSSIHLTSNDKKAKSILGNGALKEHHEEKVGKFSNDKLPNPLMTRFEGDDRKHDGQIFKVTQRPNVEKSNWMKLPWEDRMKAAHDQGRLVLLQNLYPEYTSGEVEDIVWHACRENCTAKMVSHTATSNPYSGQAFVIFKTREAMEKVVKKLEDGCLMLPNRRPLVVCPGVLPKKSEKQTFAGHLAIEKARRQIQRELKDAVSTSHYSQNNTVEYEMAMAWCFLQAKSDKWWEKLYEQQRKELKTLEDGLKSK